MSEWIDVETYETKVGAWDGKLVDIKYEDGTIKCDCEYGYEDENYDGDYWCSWKDKDGHIIERPAFVREI